VAAGRCDTLSASWPSSCERSASLRRFGLTPLLEGHPQKQLSVKVLPERIHRRRRWRNSCARCYAKNPQSYTVTPVAPRKPETRASFSPLLASSSPGYSSAGPCGACSGMSEATWSPYPGPPGSNVQSDKMPGAVESKRVPCATSRSPLEKLTDFGARNVPTITCKAN
jgi:hypothetical protein